MTDEIVENEPAKIVYAIRLANVIDDQGNAHEVYVEVAQLETMHMEFDLTDPDAVYVMACMYVVDVLGFADSSTATMIELLWDRPEGTR